MGSPKHFPLFCGYFFQKKTVLWVNEKVPTEQWKVLGASGDNNRTIGRPKVD